ncbi:MAG: diaminopimelate epimerase [Lentisphaerales bacterium]|jgi:diaminopimelate epimerase|nr:MAG: diaminopimelate epimerase [Lentisphaerales bacterium]
MKIPFIKMHGAGNDFILVDDRQGFVPAADTAWIARVSGRRTGVGSDGMILIQKSTEADFRMRFFNPDGREAEMCGNGARCAARLAHRIGVASTEMRIETAAGLLDAEILGESIRLHMTEPVDWRMERTLDLNGRVVTYSFVLSGVPHTVIQVDNLAAVDVQKDGSAIRHHPDFAPAGTNVNFIAKTGPKAISIRTYERGVEAETLACGTGITAAALVAGRLGQVTPPVQVMTVGGEVLVVDYALEGETVKNLTLFGPAVEVFEGTIDYP